MRIRVLTWLVLVGALFGVAQADEDAKTVFEHGTALFALHKFGEAAVEFEKAFEMRPDAAILYNAAQAHRLAGNSDRALELYQSLLRLYGDRVANRAEIADHIRELRRAVDAQHRAAHAPPLTTLRTPGPIKPAPSPPPEAPPPAVVAPVAAPPPPVMVVETRPAPPKRPITRRPWFWGVVAGAAVVVVGVVVGVGVGVGAAPGDPKASFGGIMVH